MASPNSRQGFINYCLRQLGHPVVNIEVDGEQISDLVDDALQKFGLEHVDGVEKLYLKHQITDEDVENEYITLSDAIIGVTRLAPIGLSTAGGPFSMQYQFMQQHGFDVYSSQTIFYDTAQRYISLMDRYFSVVPLLEFNMHMDKLYILTNKDTYLKSGKYIVIECYRVLDPSDYPDIWNDMWLKKYTTALIKRQWGQNLMKFEGAQMPGGMSMNGRQLYDDATTQIEQLEEELEMKYQEPIDFFMA